MQIGCRVPGVKGMWIAGLGFGNSGRWPWHEIVGAVFFQKGRWQETLTPLNRFCRRLRILGG